VLKTVKRALAFLSPKERIKYFTLVGLRALVSVFDLIGILAIGFLATSIALFVTLGSSANRVIEFAGLTLPAITAQTLPGVAIGILLLFVVKAVVSILLTRALAVFLAKIEARAARQVASAAFGQGLSDARKYSREEIYFAVQAGSPAAFNFILNSTGTIVAEGLLFALVIGAFFTVDPLSALGAIVYFGGIALIIQFFLGRLMHAAAFKNTEATIQGNSVIGDLSEVLREATILEKKDFFFEKLYQARIKVASSSASQFVLAGMPRYIVETALIIAVTIFVLVQSATGDLVSAAGIVGVFLSGGLRLTASLLPLQSALLTIKQVVPQANKALDLIFGSEPYSFNGEFKTTPGAQKSGPLPIEVKKVSFSYPAATGNSVTEISFIVTAGQQVALIGPSGAGKSTVADLITGLLEPTSGEISVDQDNPKDIIRNSPGRIAYVPQRPGIVSGTILENIALGVSKDKVNQDFLKQAIEDSQLSKVISQLPDGVNTDLGKRRDELSGGQLQRIGLARALYTQPGLLVMDEATSALDADSENEINKALDAMRRKVTVILIAHRLNTVQRSDQVFLMEIGKITGSGTFAELLQKSKTVQALAKLMAIESTN
jgi:ABC-type bacteriocin/lantibiotic exporter with double-glycine peptidase domain